MRGHIDLIDLILLVKCVPSLSEQDYAGTRYLDILKRAWIKRVLMTQQFFDK